MEEKKVVKFKKDEFAVKEYIKKEIGMGKVSRVRIEYTPVGEKIIVTTHKPGLIIGRGGEKISELTRTLKIKFKLENPRIEIEEIKEPEFDSQIMADEIAMGLERFGPLKFKILAYKTLQKIIDAGALGAEIRLGGKLPSSRARSWLFSQGYLKKTGDSAKVVDKAHAVAQTKPGTVGIKVAILSPHAPMTDRIIIDDNLIKSLRENNKTIEEIKEIKPKKRKKKTE